MSQITPVWLLSTTKGSSHSLVQSKSWLLALAPPFFLLVASVPALFSSPMSQAVAVTPAKKRRSYYSKITLYTK